MGRLIQPVQGFLGIATSAWKLTVLGTLMPSMAPTSWNSPKRPNQKGYLLSAAGGFIDLSAG